MPSMVSDYTNALTAVKGWPALTPLTTDGGYNPEHAAQIVAGRCVAFNSSAKFEAGAKLAQMPAFLTRSATSLDVATDRHNSFGGTTLPEGNLGALVAAGSYELETTEFDDTKSYGPGDILTSPTRDKVTGSDYSACGKLFKSKNWPGGSDAALNAASDKVVGVCTWGRRRAMVDGPVTGAKYTSPYGNSVLAFWPVYVIATS